MSDRFARHGQYAVEGWHLQALETLARRLYTENRMDGNTMRDAAHVLTLMIDAAIPLDGPARGDPS